MTRRLSRLTIAIAALTFLTGCASDSDRPDAGEAPTPVSTPTPSVGQTQAPGVVVNGSSPDDASLQAKAGSRCRVDTKTQAVQAPVAVTGKVHRPILAQVRLEVTDATGAPITMGFVDLEFPKVGSVSKTTQVTAPIDPKAFTANTRCVLTLVWAPPADTAR